ncbi:class I SAM-dependent methyltransferase [Pseudoalteromonas sp. SSDWG2]|uniref:class I SAM-dependent methyltransferase n=1 Tax=Pseudoalteromonas sp. SSDWG2 TaxID=3139391 RepID=UPI003BACE3DA
MKFSLKTLVAASLAVSLNACAATSVTEMLTEATQNELRSEQAQARDQYRHPVQTLEFFGITPQMTVVEISPGGGWYTDILAPLLKGEGVLYAAHFPADSQVKYYQNSLAKFKDKIANTKEYSEIRLTEFYPGTHHSIAPEGSADMVLTFRNLHNWYMNADEQGVKDAMRAFYTALKPGGVLGIVDHRLPESRDAAKAKRSGYVKESWVIALAQEAGFELADKSEINANPKDFADHPKGVWTLPPSLSLGDEDRAKYEAIGESDRMTLKFIKPQ